MLHSPPHLKPASAAAAAPHIQPQRPAASRPWKPAARAPSPRPRPSTEPTSCRPSPRRKSRTVARSAETLPLCYQTLWTPLAGICAFLAKTHGSGSDWRKEQRLVGNVVDDRVRACRGSAAEAGQTGQGLCASSRQQVGSG